MKNHPFYKKIVAFGFSLFMISVPLFIFLEVDFGKPLDFKSDQGIVRVLFITSIAFMFVGFILSKIKSK